MVISRKLNLHEIIEMGGLEPTNSILEPYTSLTPGVIPSAFIDEINYFAKKRDGLFFGLYAKKNSKAVFYSPSVELTATLSFLDKDGIEMMLGESIDRLTIAKQRVNKEIIDVLTNPNSYVKTKGYHNIISKKGVNLSYFCGRAGNAVVESKVSGRYIDVVKQLITLQDGELVFPDSLGAVCTCMLGLMFYNRIEDLDLVPRCHHLRKYERSLSNPLLSDNITIYEWPGGDELDTIDNIFSPFSPLEDPASGSAYLRDIVRKGLENFLLKHRPKLKQDDLKDAYKGSGYTWKRVELDAFLLSHKEIINPNVLEWFDKYYDYGQSVLKTSAFFGDFKVVDIREREAEHVINETTKKLEHWVNGHWYMVFHALREKNTGDLWVALNNSYFKYDDLTKNELLKRHSFLEDHHVTHNPPTYDHNIPADSDYEVVHVEKVWNMISPAETKFYTRPFSVAKLPGNISLYLGPYQMRKVS